MHYMQPEIKKAGTIGYQQFGQTARCLCHGKSYWTLQEMVEDHEKKE